MARTFKQGETTEVRTEQKWEPSQAERLKRFLEKNSLKQATFVKNAVLAAIDASEGAPKRAFEPIRVLGYIPGGPALEVVPMPDHTVATPPFSVGANCYALLVVGDSMETDTPDSIPAGSYAVFCPDVSAPYGVPVHVQWEESEGVTLCTLKRYCPMPDGKTVSFQPLNKKHKAITRAIGQFQIKGVFMQAWKE